jgi:hypothetical protein
MANNTICNRRAKFYKDKNYYCRIHAKNRPFLIPSNDMKCSRLKHKKAVELREICREKKYNIKKKAKKSDYLYAITLDISNNYFNFVENVDSRKVDLITYGKQIKMKFLENFGNIAIDEVIIENQVGPLALRMKVLQGMIMQHFIEHNYPVIKEISPANKLREFIQGQKTTYGQRKKLSVQITKRLLDETKGLENWTGHFATHKKKDDLADAFLQARWYITKKLYS